MFPRASADLEGVTLRPLRVEPVPTLGIRDVRGLTVSFIFPPLARLSRDFVGCVVNFTTDVFGEFAARAKEVCREVVIQKQFSKCRGEDGRCVQAMELESRKLVHYFSTRFRSDAVAVSANYVLGQKRSPDELLALRTIALSSHSSLFHDIAGIPGLFALVAFDACAAIMVAVLLVFAVMQDFWTEKKSFLGLLAVLGIGVAVGLCFYTFVATGYQELGFSPRVPDVPKVAVNVLGRIVQIVFVLLFALFTWVLIGAILETFYPEKRGLHLVTNVMLAAVSAIVSVYTIAMTVVHSLRTETLVIDASVPLLAGVSFIFGAALTSMWLLAWRLVVSEKSGKSSAEKMQRNAAVFFAGSLLLSVLFLAKFVVSLLSLLVDFYRFEMPLLILELVCHVLMVAAVLGYVGAAVIGARKSKTHLQLETAKNTGYVRLEEERDTPERYKNF